MTDSWALWWNVIYKTQIKLLVSTTSINSLTVSGCTIYPKSHSTLDTMAYSHDLVFRTCSRSFQRRLTHLKRPSAWSRPCSFSLKTFLIDAQGIYFTILISICLTLRWDSLLLILQKSNFSYLQLDWKGHGVWLGKTCWSDPHWD